MKRVDQVEKFYSVKYTKSELAEAINNINLRPHFEKPIEEELNIRDFVLTYLSYKTAHDKFAILWKSFNMEQRVDAVYTLIMSHDVIKDKFFSEQEMSLKIKLFLSEKQKKLNGGML